MWLKIRNTFIIFLVSGFWHGANWTFIVWGFLNALFIMPSILFNTNRNNIETVAQGRNYPNFRELLSMVITYCLTVFAWIFFRAENLTHAWSYIVGILTNQACVTPLKVRGDILFLLLFFVLIEWFGRNEQFAIAKTGLNWKPSIRYTFYFALIITLFWFGGKDQQFIYFTF